ncbi:hypothetical protein PIROE2DRAFT_18511 [Piromyces sp. E2]|nr:hypothetical protein PIROE2DRAFT_18511 [Piromyces sp. E2]|eukprot:OUM56748.1 hypothetical protein PIROE2DRAFT_18511 [Piromyces sp. E2]
MAYENKEIKVNIDDVNNEINSLTEDSDTDVPNQNNKTCESKENNSIKKNLSILKQFSIKKVYLVTISAFSILSLLLLLLKKCNKYFYDEIFEMSVEEKRIEKEIKPIYDNGHSEMNTEESKRLMYRHALIPMIYYCILAPFVEEYLFRGLIFGFIKNYGQKVKKSGKFKVDTVFAIYMFASDCYDSCDINVISVTYPFYGVMILIVVVVVIVKIIKIFKL